MNLLDLKNYNGLKIEYLSHDYSKMLRFDKKTV